MQRNILSIVTVIFLLVSPMMAIVTNDTATSETNPSSIYSTFNWNGVCQYGSGTGKTLTAVDKYWLITSRHYGLSVGNTFVANGVTYTITEVVNHSASADPNHTTDADLSLICVNKSLSTYYDIYTGSISTSGQKTSVLMVGTGHAKGTITDNPTPPDAYTWDTATTRQRRWGTNKIDQVGSATIGGYTEDYLMAAFTLNDTTYEAGMADHDSGGGWFVNDNDTWKLTAISIAVASISGSSPYNYSYAVDLRDYSDWVDSIVPEPATVALLTIGGIALLRKRRK